MATTDAELAPLSKQTAEAPRPQRGPGRPAAVAACAIAAVALAGLGVSSRQLTAGSKGGAVSMLEQPEASGRPVGAGRGAEIPSGVCDRRRQATAAGAKKAEQNQTAVANSPSLNEHKLPAWWRDAKLGIFIHWGLYSVPAFASKKYSYAKYHEVDREDYDRNNPYAEWYLLTSLINDSATAEVHRARYGQEPSMDSYLKTFVPIFNAESQEWKPEEWASLFRRAGAGYVVLTTKHHDSFLLWPSEVVNPHRKADYQHASRDIVGDLTRAVRSAGMEMGLYYSGGLDWSFESSRCRPNTVAYEKLAYAHLSELIDRYRPSILWDDIDWPGNGSSKMKRLHQTLSHYLNDVCPEGTVNDRWNVTDGWSGDFGTPEYGNLNNVSQNPFELCRGIGQSFGLNAEEGSEDYMKPAEAVWLLVDVAAKNGNLLLDVGPAANGSVPWHQERVLTGLGAWIGINGEAVQGTRPYLAAGEPVQGDVRYTTKGSDVYAVVRGVGAGSGSSVLHLDLPELMAAEAGAELLVRGGAEPLHLRDGGWLLPETALKRTSLRSDSDMPIALRFGSVRASLGAVSAKSLRAP